MFMIMFLVFMQLIQSFAGTGDNTNILGHLFGLIYGFFLCFVICTPDYPDSTACFKYLYWRIFSSVVCGGTLIGGIVFLSIKYSKN